MRKETMKSIAMTLHNLVRDNAEELLNKCESATHYDNNYKLAVGYYDACIELLDSVDFWELDNMTKSELDNALETLDNANTKSVVGLSFARDIISTPVEEIEDTEEYKTYSDLLIEESEGIEGCDPSYTMDQMLPCECFNLDDDATIKWTDIVK